MHPRGVIQADRLTAVQTIGVRKSRALAVKVMAVTLTAYRKGHLPDLTALIHKRLSPVLFEAVNLSWLLGGVIAEENVKVYKGDVTLSFFGQVTKAARKAASKQLKAKALQASISNTEKANAALQTLAGGLNQDIRDYIADLIGQGAHIGEGVAALRQKFIDLGIAGPKPYRIEAFFRTQTQVSYGAGQWDAYQDPDVQEILWGYEYVTVGDDRVRPSHEALDGMRLEKDDPRWQSLWPPNGWNCRCQVIPIFDRGRVKEPKALPDGSKPEPDKGFDFNPGQILATAV